MLQSNRGRLRLVNLYRYFLALALLLVPFGRKRAICDHHRQLGFADLFQSFTAKVAHKRKDTSHWCCSRVITLKYQMSCQSCSSIWSLVFQTELTSKRRKDRVHPSIHTILSYFCLILSHCILFSCLCHCHSLTMLNLCYTAS